MMRIISGKARGVRLNTPDGTKTRPTAERVKEALFSMLQFELPGMRVLDLFGGSGQIALEALSRGAASAVVCDNSPDAITAIRANIAKTRLSGCTVLACDYQRALSMLHPQSFDLIFLDPPYRLNLIPNTLRLITEHDLICGSGIIACEDEKDEPYSLPGYTLRKHAKYGRIYLSVLQKEIQN